MNFRHMKPIHMFGILKASNSEPTKTLGNHVLEKHSFTISKSKSFLKALKYE